MSVRMCDYSHYQLIPFGLLLDLCDRRSWSFDWLSLVYRLLVLAHGSSRHSTLVQCLGLHQSYLMLPLVGHGLIYILLARNPTAYWCKRHPLCLWSFGVDQSILCWLHRRHRYSVPWRFGHPPYRSPLCWDLLNHAWSFDHWSRFDLVCSLRSLDFGSFLSSALDSMLYSRSHQLLYRSCQSKWIDSLSCRYLPHFGLSLVRYRKHKLLFGSLSLVHLRLLLSRA